MSSRKRKDPHPPESPRTPSKRTRFQQAVSQTSTSSGPACKYGTSRSAYAINGILKESEDKYLIDWAPDLTGNIWRPDWQLKKNANAAAVNLWTTRNSTKGTEVSAKKPRLKLTHKNAKEHLGKGASTDSLPPQPPEPFKVDDKSQSEPIEPLTPLVVSEQSSSSIQEILSSVDIAKFPDVAIQIEPRESLDKEAYIAYGSSLSNPVASRSTGEHSDSGFEESSSRETSPFHREKDIGTVVPDSQSVPEPSDSLPIQTTSSGYKRSPPALKNFDPRETSGVVIPASQPSKAGSERRGSEPAAKLVKTVATPSIELAPSNLLRTASDPEKHVGNGHAHQFIPRQRQNRRVVIDSPSPSRASPPSHQPEVPLQSIEPPEDITQLDIPFGEDGHPQSPVLSPVLLTQVPLHLEHQGSQASLQQPIEDTRTPIGPLIIRPDVWQVGQVKAAVEQIACGKSSDRVPETETHSERPKQVQQIEYGSTIRNDKCDQTHLSETTPVDQLNPDTQYSHPISESYPQWGRPGASDTVDKKTTNLGSTGNLLESSEISKLTKTPLQDTLNSGIPPKLPTSSDIDMSDNARAESTGTVESRLNEMRRQVQDARAINDAKLAALKTGKMQSTIDSASPMPSLERTQLEVKTKPAIAVQSPRGHKSPSLARIAVTPKGPLSPIALGSPRGIQAISPQSARSPSKIPESEPYQPQEEPSFLSVEPTEMARDLHASMVASRRVSKSARNTSMQGGETNADNITSTKSESQSQTTTLDLQKLGPMEFVMPLSMPPRTQKQYLYTYKFFHRKIVSFIQGQDVSKDVIEDLNVMLDRIAKVTTHMDLDGGGPDGQDEVDIVGEAGYAVSVSEKFRFLVYVLKLARDLDMHFAIVARSGQLCEFIQTTLKAQRVTYSYSLNDEGSNRDIMDFGSQLHVTLSASGPGIFAHTAYTEKADLVIAFDETFDAGNPEVKALRGFMPTQDRLTPVIRLVIYATLEHIHLCLPTTLEPNDRLQKLLYYMLYAENSVGQLAPDNPEQSPSDPSLWAGQLIEFVAGGAIPETFNLPSMPPIANIPTIPSESSLSDVISEISDSMKAEGEVRYWPSALPSQPRLSQRNVGEKRPFDLEYGDSVELQAKKIKTGMLVSKGRQFGASEALRNFRDNERIKDLETKLAHAEASNYDPGNPMSWQSRVNVFDEANRERRELRVTVTNLNTTIEKLTINLASSREETAAVKAALADVRFKNDTLHDRLLDNPRPDVQQAELARRRLQELENIDAAKTKKLANTENDLAFARKMYQEASTAASAASSDLDSIQPRLKATEAQLEALQQERKNSRAEQRSSLQPHLKEKAALKETLKQRDKELQAMKLELDGLKRGRQGVQTRGSSMQPVGARSPRGSRGVSPAVTGLVPGAHGPGHQGGVAMARGPSGLGISSRLGGAF